MILKGAEKVMKNDATTLVDEIFDIFYDAISDLKENGLGIEFIAEITRKFSEIEID